jgi:RNA-directed DNA polymerase
LSPLLANVLLDEVDKELEKRGHAFVRYADDCNVYVGSRRAGERVMEMLRRLYAGLHLRVNETKSAVARARDRKFLGYSFWVAKGGEVKLRVAPKALDAMKNRVREITTRSGGRSMKAVVAELRSYLTGWREYFQLARTRSVFEHLDSWIRRRLRALQLKQWKRGTTAYRELQKLGVSDFWCRMVASAMHRLYWNSNVHAQVALPNEHFDRLGVPRLNR